MKFDFTPIVSKKKQSVRKDTYSQGKYSVVGKEYEGIVCISLDGNYYVRIEDQTYNIISENYNTENVSKVYLQKLDSNGQRILLIRSLLVNKKISNVYLPFAPGIYVIGDIVVNNYTKEIMFNIKKILHDDKDNGCHQALKFYQDNYDIIQKALKAK